MRDNPTLQHRSEPCTSHTAPSDNRVFFQPHTSIDSSYQLITRSSTEVHLPATCGAEEDLGLSRPQIRMRLSGYWAIKRFDCHSLVELLPALKAYGKINLTLAEVILPRFKFLWWNQAHVAGEDIGWTGWDLVLLSTSNSSLCSFSSLHTLFVSLLFSASYTFIYAFLSILPIMNRSVILDGCSADSQVSRCNTSCLGGPQIGQAVGHGPYLTAKPGRS